jgi:hypothetical protein
VGLAVTSHDNNVLGTATFDGVVTTAGGDTAPPIISAVTSGTPTQNGTSISWTTNEPADSRVEYGTTVQYGSTTATNTSLVTNHQIVVPSLDAGVTYHYRVRSRDAAGNEAMSADYTFTVPPAPTTTTTVPPTTTTTATTTTTTTTATTTTTTTVGPTTTTTATAAALALDKVVTTKQTVGSQTVTSPTFATSAPNELFVAFIASDGPTTTQTFYSVTGGGLTWTLRMRINAQRGTAEIWTATAVNALASVSVTARRSTGSYQGMITVAAFRNAGVGAVGGSNGPNGAPTASLVTTAAGAWVWAVGDDWDAAVARTVGSGQTKVDELLAPASDTFWVQRQTAMTPSAGTMVVINDTAPSNDRWNLAVIEIVPR